MPIAPPDTCRPFVLSLDGGFVPLFGLSASGDNAPEAELNGLDVRSGIIPASPLAVRIPFCC